MILSARLFAAGIACLAFVVLDEILRAPEGYEDEHGFHFVCGGAIG